MGLLENKYATFDREYQLKHSYIMTLQQRKETLGYIFVTEKRSRPKVLWGRIVFNSVVFTMFYIYRKISL